MFFYTRFIGSDSIYLTEFPVIGARDHASHARILPRRTASARRMTCIFCIIPSRQQVVADTPEQQQPLGLQCLGADHCGEPALERREHGPHYAALVVRRFKLWGSPAT